MLDLCHTYPWHIEKVGVEKIRVVCFDLWGTLIKSAYAGETYEDYLSHWVNRHEIQAIVRQVLMTRDIRRNELIREEPNFCFDCDFEIWDWDYRELVAELFYQLEMDTNTSHVHIDSAGVPSVPRYHIAGQWLPKAECPDLATMARLWQIENDMVTWMPNANALLAMLRRDCPKTKLVLVTNTSGRGWKDVDKQLNVSQYFDRVYISAKERAAKPDPYVWQTIQRWYPDADEFWMIGDDHLLDIAMPSALGWQTLQVDRNGMALTEVATALGTKR